MNSPVEFEPRLNDLPTGSAMSDAIDVLASLAEHAERMAGNGDNEFAMAKALSASFAYMVAYFHHLAMDHREPHDALTKAAAGVPELEAAELDFLRAYAAHYTA